MYFPDFTGTQHKNKFNVVNLINHEREFKIKDESIFFATSHGKGAYDGIGGTVKRHTMSRNNNSILTLCGKNFSITLILQIYAL